MVKAKIMVVEDEGVVGLAIKHCLENFGYEVPAIISTGEDAIKKALEFYPDLILMDIRLKGELDGIAAAQQIKQDYNIPVIYLTAYSDNTTLERAKITEPFGYILKPFEEKSLQTTIEMGLYKSQMQKHLQTTKDRLATILRCIGDGVIVADIKGQINFLNPAAEELTEYTHEEALGNSLHDVVKVINEKTREHTSLPLTRTILDGEKGTQDEYVLVTKEEKEIPIDFSISPIKNENNNTTGIVLALRDIRERKKVGEMVQRELEATEEMQKNLLPSHDPNLLGVKIDWIFKSSTFGAGDLINFFPLGDRHVVFYLFDVIGHGLQATVMSMMLHRILSTDLNRGGIIKMQDSGFTQPREIVATLNRQFYTQDASQFFTIIYGVLNTITGKTTIVRAGHHYPILQRHNEATSLITSQCYAVGILPDNKPQEYELNLEKGDRIFLYSDGLIECLNNEMEQFSLSRLQSYIEEKSSFDLKELAKNLEDEIHGWRGKNQYDDDISFLVLEKL